MNSPCKATDEVVSMVENAWNTKTKDTVVKLVLAVIKNGKWRKKTEHIRAEYHHALRAGQDAKDVVAGLKKQLPGVLWSGRFNSRKRSIPLDDKLRNRSGILCADIDNIADRLDQVKTALIASPYAVATFLSPTGTGLKVLFRISKTADHKRSFLAVQRHVRELTGCDIDSQCSDITRMAFVSYDPGLWVRSDEAEVLSECTYTTDRPYKPQTIQNSHTVQSAHTSHMTNNSQISQGSDTVSSPSSPAVVHTIAEAVRLALPSRPNKNHSHLCKLAGALKAHELTAGVVLTNKELKEAFCAWYKRATPFLKLSQSEQAYFLEFMDAWSNIKGPLGETAVQIAFRRAQSAPIPREASIKDFDDPDICLLISLCRELQIIAGNLPFYLSPYTVKELFAQSSHSTAAKWLSGLCALGLLTRIEKGDFGKRRASSYRFNFSSEVKSQAR